MSQESETRCTDGMALIETFRPEVLRAHRALVRAVGTSLPPATKQLILVTLSTLQGSERALRRHASRALATGAEPDHILDAVMMALPVAGMTQVADALLAVSGILTHADGPEEEDDEA
ncbi:MAG: carboxymuconolactone decarboxylase family protein [Gemmatimonadota bacterium]